jgi:hypothetical protein
VVATGGGGLGEAFEEALAEDEQPVAAGSRERKTEPDSLLTSEERAIP